MGSSCRELGSSLPGRELAALVTRGGGAGERMSRTVEKGMRRLAVYDTASLSSYVSSMYPPCSLVLFA